MGIVHRDIKLENILYENHSKNATVRLIDFGLSRTFDRRSSAADYVRTPYTISPETAKVLLSNKDARACDEIMTDKKDVWAVGVITFLLLSGEFPFIKSSSDLRDPKKMDKLKMVSVLAVLPDLVYGTLGTHYAIHFVPTFF
jgi:serine/threonine protein kinase